MKCTTILFLPFLLLVCGCSTNSVTDYIIDSTTNSVNAIEQALPDECKTASVTAQLITLKSQIRTVQASCTSEKKALSGERDRWRLAFFALVGLIIAYIVRKVLK